MNGMKPADSGKVVHSGSSRLASMTTSPLRTIHGCRLTRATTPVRPLPPGSSPNIIISRSRPRPGPLSVASTPVISAP